MPIRQSFQICLSLWQIYQTLKRSSIQIHHRLWRNLLFRNGQKEKLWLKKAFFHSCDRICQNRAVGCDKCCDFFAKKKRPFSEVSAQRYYRWGSYILLNSIKTWFKSQVVIDNPEGMNHVDFNNTRQASPLDAHLGGFFCMESNMKT